MCSKILVVLDKLMAWVDEVPPIEQPQRFGNKAFKTWLNKVKEVSFDKLFQFSMQNSGIITKPILECQ